MDQIALVDEREAAERFVAAYGQRVPVTAAFWMKESDATRWRLCLVTDHVTKDEAIDAAYELLGTVEDEMHEPRFDSFQCMLVNPDSGLATGADALRKAEPNRRTFRLDGRWMGGRWVDEIVFVPVPAAATV